LNSAAC
jgi:hypothetical protein